MDKTMFDQELSTDRIEAIIGKNIKSLRIKKNLTQSELAARAGLSKRTISNIENGNGASLASLIDVFRVLGMLENLAALFPSTELSPLELLKAQGKKRKRASSKAPRSTDEESSW